MRDYNSETDYCHVLEAARRSNNVSLAAIARHLAAVGIEFPRDFNRSQTPLAIALDRDIARAWRELGLCPLISTSK